MLFNAFAVILKAVSFVAIFVKRIQSFACCIIVGSSSTFKRATVIIVRFC